MKILKMKKTSNGRYKVTLDNGSDLLLYEETVINNIILTGKNIDEETYKEILDNNYKVTPYHQALQYINTRMRSREEIREYLLKKNNDEALINETISRLSKEGYINDLSFAKAYISDKLNLSNDGTNKMRRALCNYGVSEDIINQSLAMIDDQELGDRIAKLIAKQMKLKTKYTGNILKNRILNYLVNLGYDSSLVLEKLNSQSFKNNSNIEHDYQKLYKKYESKYNGYKLEMTIKQHLYQKGYDATDIEMVTK